MADFGVSYIIKFIYSILTILLLVFVYTILPILKRRDVNAPYHPTMPLLKVSPYSPSSISFLPALFLIR